jgi:hypothetical protein
MSRCTYFRNVRSANERRQTGVFYAERDELEFAVKVRAKRGPDHLPSA